jgi:hypothetical protein
MSKLISNCVKVLEKENMKEEINTLFKPLIDLILIEIYPYVYISLLFIVMCFLLILGIFIILMRSNYTIKANQL